jgi:hypothetical protein
MTTAWSHLPNAAHIDRMLAHLKAHPDRWVAARDAARGAARDAAYDAAWGAARGAAWVAARGAARDAAGDAAWDAARVAAWDATRAAIAALIAWDDCAGILDMPADAVKFLAANGHHPAVLLLPAVLAMGEKL